MGCFGPICSLHLPMQCGCPLLESGLGWPSIPHWRMGTNRARLDLEKFGMGEVGRAQGPGQSVQEKGEKGERRKGQDPAARPIGAGARGDEKLGTGTAEWGRCRPSPCGLWGMRVGVGGREGISPGCPAKEAGRDRDGRGCRSSSLRPSVLKTAAESDFRSLENQRNCKRNGTGRPGSRLDRSREGPRSPLRDSEPPSCRPGRKGADESGGAAAPARGDAPGVRGSLLCPRHLHAHGLERGNAGAVILPFTPSLLSFPLWMRPWERFAPRVAVRSRCRQCVCGCVRRGRSRRVGELRRASSQETRPFSSRLL